jgi:hypothetical protein
MMNPMRIWLGSLLLALGLFGILDVTGTLAWDESVGQWWPLAIIAFALAEMAVARRVTLGLAIVAAIGVGLLASEQRWASEWVWSLLLAGLGLGVLFGLGRSGRPEPQDGDREQSHVEPTKAGGPL